MGANTTILADADADSQRRFAYASVKEHIRATLFFTLAAAIVIWGWAIDLFDYLTPEAGLGYALGIVGASMMMLLLVYPLRKKARWMRRLGATSIWFRIHMVFGIIGPICILFHARFSIGSLNSTLALVSMLVVAGSGIIGRYLYSKVHYGLYGACINHEQLKRESEHARYSLERAIGTNSNIFARLHCFEQTAATPTESLLISAWKVIAFRRQSWRIWRQLKHHLRRSAHDHSQTHDNASAIQTSDTEQIVKAYVLSARKVVGLCFFERLFALWHLLHVPLFILLVLTAIAHIIAVHMF